MGNYLYLGNNPVLIGRATSSQWQRVQDWLPMPDTSSMTGSQGAFVGLFAIYTGSSNFVALSAAPSYSVNWGDGSTSSYYASGVQAQYQYTYDNLSDSTYSSGSNGKGGVGATGYRQALITVLPSGSSNLTSINLQKKHTQAGLPSTVSINWLDVSVGGGNINTLSIGGNSDYLQSIERCNIVNFSSSLTSLQTLFTNCYSLQSVPLFNTTNITNFSNMFANCYSLQSVPLFNTMNGTNFGNMFTNCTSLQSVPLFNTQSGSNFTIMFQSCYSLQSVPLFNTMNGTNFTSMFQSCASLQSVPLFNTMNGTNFSNMFANCTSLQSVPLFNTRSGSNFTIMFQSCTSLQSVPLFNTMNGTNFINMFANCTSLQSVPLFNTTNTAASASGVFATVFSGCPNLKIAAFSGSRSTISYSGCSLDHDSLVNIFNNLAITGSTPCTITTSLNWGSASLSPSDIQIATNKGWTVQN